MMAGLQLHEQLVARGQGTNDDLLKVLAGLIGGVGFLGAGSILRANGEVHGLTTASTIWTTSAIGVACSLGFFVLSGDRGRTGTAHFAHSRASAALAPDSDIAASQPRLPTRPLTVRSRQSCAAPRFANL